MIRNRLDVIERLGSLQTRNVIALSIPNLFLLYLRLNYKREQKEMRLYEWVARLPPIPGVATAVQCLNLGLKGDLRQITTHFLAHVSQALLLIKKV